MISKLVAHKKIEKAEDGFELIFSGEELLDYDAVLSWEGSGEVNYGGDEYSGNWFRGEVAGEKMRGWLCPALFKYFEKVPEKIYVKAGLLPEGLDPIWHEEGDAFVTGSQL